MKSWQFALVGLVALAMAGCRADPNNAMYLEHELRMQEDEIFRLRDCLEMCQAELDALRRAESGEGDLDSQRGTGLFGGLGGPALTREQDGSDAASDDSAYGAPPVEMPEESTQEVPEQFRAPGEPSSEMPGFLRTPTEPREVPRQGFGFPSEDPLPRQIPGAQGDGSGEGFDSSGGPVGPHLQMSSTDVVRVALNRRLSGGYNADDRRGDEGVRVVLEPRDDQDQYIEAPASVSVVMIDPSVEGEAARVARWDFTPEQTRSRFRSSGSRRGLVLELLWPSRPPSNPALQLFVRYTTEDGRKLQVDMPVEVALNDGSHPGWVATEPPKEAPIRTARRFKPSSAVRSSVPTSPTPPSPAPATSSTPTMRFPTREVPAVPIAPARASDEPPSRPAWSPDRE